MFNYVSAIGDSGDRRRSPNLNNGRQTMKYLVRSKVNRKMVESDSPYNAVKSVYTDYEIGFCSRLGNSFTYMVEKSELTEFTQYEVKVYEIDEDKREKHCCFKELNISGRCIANCHMAKVDMDCTGATGLTADYDSRHEVRVSMGHIDGRTLPAPENKVEKDTEVELGRRYSPY